MLTIEEIRKLKSACRYTNEQLSRLSGVPLGTVQKVLGNTTSSPRVQTLQALSDVFERDPRRKTVTFDSGKDSHRPDITYGPEDDLSSGCILQDSAPAYCIPNIVVAENIHDYPRQGTYTIDDYLALPEEQRVELIDGVFYDMAGPNIPHQLIGGDIYSQLLQYVKQHGRKCMPFIAPTDVQLDRDIWTMVQPDVLIVCDRSKINRKRVFGAPDFAVEILSPSSKRKDLLIKSAKYHNAGVREYWLVDPMAETVTVFLFEGEIQMHVYTFEETVPVWIYNGDCSIDFKEIKSFYSFLDEDSE